MNDSRSVRRDVRQPSHSDSVQSASSSLTSLDTVVHVTPAPSSVVPTSRERRAHSLPSSDSHTSSSSTPNDSSTNLSSSTSTNNTSYDSSSCSSSLSSSSSEESTSSTYSSSCSYSSSPLSPSRDLIAAKMSPKRPSSTRRKRTRDLKTAEGAASSASGEGGEKVVEKVEEADLPTPPPAKVERSDEGEERPADQCDCCSCRCRTWQSSSPSELVVLFACGSFNPITTMHLRMMGKYARVKCDLYYDFLLFLRLSRLCRWFQCPLSNVIFLNLKKGHV